METREKSDRSATEWTGRPDPIRITPGGSHGASGRVMPRCATPAADGCTLADDGYHVRGQGERALMRAVLVDAIECLTADVRRSAARAQHATEARAWVATRDDQWPFSFDNICLALDLDAERIRRRLLQIAIDLPPASAPIPRVREEEVTAMIRAGNPLRVVAARFGISMPKVSILSRGLASRLKAERNIRIRALRASGWTVSALASHFGLSLFRIRRICSHGEGRTRQGTGRHGQAVGDMAAAGAPLAAANGR